MDIVVDTRSELVSGVVDVRYVPLGRLAREASAAVGASLTRVLPESARQSVSVAAFNSSL